MPPNARFEPMAHGAKVVYTICALWFLVMLTCAWFHAPRNRLLLILPTAIFAGAFITSVVRIFTHGERLKDRPAIPSVVRIATAELTTFVAPRIFQTDLRRALTPLTALRACIQP